jgi:uncharacterized protein (DUF1697 family)
MPRFVAFLRGINVGGNKLVPMAQLRTLFEELGYDEVKTLLQSGNVVFTASSFSTLETKLEKAFMEEFGFSSDFVVRSSVELSKIIKSNPFTDEAKKDPSHLLVMFLKESASAASFSAFLKTHAGPEHVKSNGSELYIYHPEGIGRSKLKIPFNGTARNWNTLQKLLGIL